MKTLSLVTGVLLLIVGCNSNNKEVNDNSNQRDSFYSRIELGEHSVGFCDTVIFNSDVRFDFLPENGVSYTQYDYKGPIPLFLQIWYPIEQQNLKTLKFGEFRNRKLAPELQSVYDPLVEKMDSSFIRYYIIDNFTPDNDSIDYGEYSYFDVFDTIKNYQTKSQYKKISDKLDFPVIVYHHGSQGLSDENFILAEYFSSRGYIVVASNFHLPFKNKWYGYDGADFDETALPKSVIQFARTLTTNDKLYFIGHSAGAQLGFEFLYEKKWANAFVSLETTMEGRPTDYLKSDDGWPRLSKIIDEHKLDYSIPILMIANTQDEKPFPLFDELANSPMIQVSQKKWFGHESYSSAFLMRYLYIDMFPQPDAYLLGPNLELYAKQLKLYEAFLNSVESGQEFYGKEFEEDFYISIPNANKK
jgi:pimeloyl-ACP methyl ester carboxylesterase